MRFEIEMQFRFEPLRIIQKLSEIVLSHNPVSNPVRSKSCSSACFEPVHNPVSNPSPISFIFFNLT
ncbi:hypothetical protein MTR_4g019070 [Medicago truncatula]|uniref:Uncharacterized protein n=1 Tax=Medicago truncatula TaxID=3880 RepID=G7JR98_MEDTR|nr:hypothetical protein MTR_4g019070 [Medicago truncatula]